MTPFGPLPRFYLVRVTEQECEAVCAFLSHAFKPPVPAELVAQRDAAVGFFATLNLLLEQARDEGEGAE